VYALFSFTSEPQQGFFDVTTCGQSLSLVSRINPTRSYADGAVVVNYVVTAAQAVHYGPSEYFKTMSSEILHRFDVYTFIIS
jgi:hypothetical protein